MYTLEQIVEQHNKKEAFNKPMGLIATSTVLCVGMVAVLSVISPATLVVLKAHMLAKAALGLKIASGGVKVAGICLTAKGAWELVPWKKEDSK